MCAASVDFWFCKGKQDFVHLCLLVRLQSVHQFTKKRFMLIAQVSAAYVLSVRDTDAPAVSLHGKDRCRTCELFDIAYCGSAADSEFGSQLAVCCEAMIAEVFQHLLPSLKRAAHVLHLLSALLG